MSRPGTRRRQGTRPRPEPFTTWIATGMSDTKPTILLATALFLISAPEPDSGTIAELTANFIIPANERALLASDRGADELRVREESGQPRRDASVQAPQGSRPENRDRSVGPG